MEGLRFCSSLYMMLIWLRAFQWVLNNPKCVKEKLTPTLTNFRSFFDDPSADMYREDIIRQMANAEKRVALTKSSGKRRLAKLLDSDEEDDINLLGPSFLQRRDQLASDDSDQSELIIKKKKSY